MSHETLPAIPGPRPVPAVRGAQPGHWSAYAPARPAARQWEPLPGNWSRTAARWLVMGLVLLLVVGGLGWITWQRQLIPRTGQVASLGAGRLELRDGSTGPWTEATVGRPVREGAEFRVDAPGGAELRLADGARLQLDSGGAWQVLSLQVSRDGQLSRVTVRQVQGQITVTSAPVGRLDTRLLYLQVPGHNVELHGTARLTTDADGKSTLEVLTGSARVHQGGEPVTVIAGRQAILRPGSPPVGAAATP